MKLYVENELLDKLKLLDADKLENEVVIVWDDNKVLQYIGGSYEWTKRYAVGLFNNEEELYKHSKTIRLSEIITGNNEISISIVNTR